MKILLAIAVGWVLLVPISAAAVNPGECANLLRKIHHFQVLEERAEHLGNETYAGRMEMQADLIRARYDVRCEGFAEDDRAVRKAVAEWAKVLKYGAKAAAKWFTGGLY